MKLNVLLPSRGRPQKLIQAVQMMHAKASNLHELGFVIGCDADDPDTIAATYTLALKIPRVAPFVTPRMPSLGGMANAMALRFPADAYASLADDLLIETLGWDHIIWNCWQQKPDGVWWWHTVSQAACPVVSEKWRAAAGGLYTDYFPFWWDDCWLMQLWMMASGEETLRGLPATLQDQANMTHRMRDLPFWTEFYASQKEARWQKAEEIAERLHWPKPKRREVMGDVKPDFFGRIAGIEERQGDRSPPTPEYLLAKQRAASIMAVAA